MGCPKEAVKIEFLEMILGKVSNKLGKVSRFRHWLAIAVSQPGDLEINGNCSLWRYSGLRVNEATPCYIQQLPSCAYFFFNIFY